MLVGQVGCAAAASLLLSLSGPLQSAPERRVLGSWLTVVAWPGRQLQPHRASPWLIELAAVLVVSAWVVVAVALHRREQRPRVFAVGCALWCVPFVVGVPVFSRDAYAYVAQGSLLQRGADPYITPVAELGQSTILSAVDPVWRHTLTPYGPFGVRIEQFAVWAGGGEVGALVALRLGCMACVALSCACIWKTCPSPRRQLTLWLLLSPLLLVHLLTGLHLDAVVLALFALLAAAVVNRHWSLAIACAVSAGEVKATAFAVLPVLLVVAWRAEGRGRVPRHLAVAFSILALGAAAYSRDPWGWVGALQTPGSRWDPFAPASTGAMAISETLHHLGLSTPSALLPVTQAVAVALGAAALLALVLTTNRRPAVETCAWGVVVVVVASPTLWAWYLTAALPFLLLADRARMRFLALLLGSAGVLIGLPLTVVPAQRAAVAAELAAALAAASYLRQPDRG